MSLKQSFAVRTLKDKSGRNKRGTATGFFERALSFHFSQWQQRVNENPRPRVAF